MILETERLFLRRMSQSDFKALCRIMQDEETMYAYEGAFSDAEVQEWLDRQILRYDKWGFGLWAVVLKETDEMIGQCGLTMQPWKDGEVLEIGYILGGSTGTMDMQRKRQEPVRSMPLKNLTPERSVQLSEIPIQRHRMWLLETAWLWQTATQSITEVWICLIIVMWL